MVRFPFLVEFNNVSNVFVLGSKPDELKRGREKSRVSRCDFQEPREKPLIQ